MYYYSDIDWESFYYYLSILCYQLITSNTNKIHTNQHVLSHGFVVALLARGGQHTGVRITCFNTHKGTIAAVSWLLMVTLHSEHS